MSIGTAQIGYKLGISATLNLVALSIAFALLALVLVKKSKETGQTTISGISAQNYGEPVR